MDCIHLLDDTWTTYLNKSSFLAKFRIDTKSEITGVFKKSENLIVNKKVYHLKKLNFANAIS